MIKSSMTLLKTIILIVVAIIFVIMGIKKTLIIHSNIFLLIMTGIAVIVVLSFWIIGWRADKDRDSPDNLNSLNDKSHQSSGK